MKQHALTAFFLLGLIACSKKEEHNTLVTKDLNYFSLYSPTCEKWMEQTYPCKDSLCFTAVALEITGVDTAKMDSVLIYAWAWHQYFKPIEGKVHASQGDLWVVKLIAQGGGRAVKILDAYLPDEEEPLKPQLEAAAFPEDLLDEYFLNQKQEVEVKRIKALSEKAKKKFEMYKDKAYYGE